MGNYNNREKKRAECFGIFCTKSQSAQIYTVYCCCRSFSSVRCFACSFFSLLSDTFYSFLFGEITCKIHFIRCWCVCVCFYFHFIQHKRYRARYIDLPPSVCHSVLFCSALFYFALLCSPFRFVIIHTAFYAI